MNQTSTVLAVLSIVLSVASFVVSILVLSIRSKQMRATLVLSCLDQYVRIRRTRSEALKAADKEIRAALAEDYYRELTDLCWSEFRLWQQGVLASDVFALWMESRHRSYVDDVGVQLQDGTNFSQRDGWNKLTAGAYFGKDDDFVRFMELVHDGQIVEAMKSFRRFPSYESRSKAFATGPRE